jgi:hypothetical protein
MKRETRLASLSALLIAAGGCHRVFETDAQIAPLNMNIAFASIAPAASNVEVARATIEVRNDDGGVVADTTVIVLPGASEVTVAFAITVRAPDERFDVAAELNEASGLLLYRGSALSVAPGPSPINVLLTYTGPSTVEVTPATLALSPLGSRATLAAVVRDPEGGAITASTFTWRSTNPAVATVTNAGEVLAVSVGTSTVVAESFGIESTPVPVSVENRHIWIGTNGRWDDPANWSGGLIPTNRAEVDITRDGTYVVRLDGDHYDDVGILRLGKAGGTGRQALVINENDPGFGVVLGADQVLIGQSGSLDAWAVHLNSPVFQNDGIVLVREFLAVGGPYAASASSSLHLNGGSLVFTADWEVGPAVPQVPPGGPVTSAGLIDGPGFINAASRTQFLNAGVMRPGGTLNLVGTLTMASTSVLQVSLSGLAPGSGYDQLVVDGTASLTGARMDVVSGFVPPQESEFVVLQVGSRIGVFDDITGRNLPNGSFLEALYGANSLTLRCCVSGSIGGRGWGSGGRGKGPRSMPLPPTPYALPQTPISPTSTHPR